jgi:hypothetical protein
MVEVCPRVGGMYCLIFQGQIVSRASKQESSKQPTVCCMLLALLMIQLDPEDGGSTLFRNVDTLLPEYMAPHTGSHHRENLRSHIKSIYFQSFTLR